MKRLIIVCEGSTEQLFCREILGDYFMSNNILLEAPVIKKSRGGIVHWSSLRFDIRVHLISSPQVYVSTLIDYYGIDAKKEFPGWLDSVNIADKNFRMDHLENAMRRDIDENISWRFIPYLQLHEFEALLFCDPSVFYDTIPANRLIGKSELEEIIENYPNPELINDDRHHSPSHRLSRIIDGYDKVRDGVALIKSIGLHRIRAKSPRFNAWLEQLASL